MDNERDLLRQANRLETVNDVVMGGLSQSRFRYDDEADAALFTGTLSLENNGGFASAQAALPPTDIRDCRTIRLQVRGDGREYGLNLRSAGMERVSYRVYFTAPDEWQTLMFPLVDFRPIRTGDTVPDAPPLDTTQITMVGFILVGQPGEFRLAVRGVWPARQDAM